MSEQKKKYQVEVKECQGSCNSRLFEKMAKRGDITAVKVEDIVGNVVKITGFAVCRIITDEKDFHLGYYATPFGFISTGSQIFFESVKNYLEDVDTFSIVKVKTKKGITYKAVPILEMETEETEETDDLSL